METIKMTDIIRSDVHSVQIIITFIDGLNNSSSINENYCICDNVNFSISKI
jgi:hypothetical protein